MVLVLFDSPAGHCLFKVTDASMLKKPDTIWDMFTSPANANKACAAATSRAHSRTGRTRAPETLTRASRR